MDSYSKSSIQSLYILRLNQNLKEIQSLKSPSIFIIFTILLNCYSVFISNGISPINNSYANIPIAHKSTFSSYDWPCNNSGETYNGVPQKVVLNYFPR